MTLGTFGTIDEFRPEIHMVTCLTLKRLSYIAIICIVQIIIVQCFALCIIENIVVI